MTLWADSNHYAELFFAGGTLTAWVSDGSGSGEVNLNPDSPKYDSSAMQ